MSDERDDRMRERWTAIYVDGKTWIEDCGCSTSEHLTSMCREHWDSLQKKLDAPEDPERIKRMRTALGLDNA